MLREDISAIEAWLAQIGGIQVRPVRDKEPLGEFLWSVQGLPYSWRCEAVYQRSRPDIVVLRLLAEVSSAQALPDKEKLGLTCASRGVQPTGSTGNSGHWWATQQAVLTAWLRPTLFGPIVERLAAMLGQVASGS